MAGLLVLGVARGRTPGRVLPLSERERLASRAREVHREKFGLPSRQLPGRAAQRLHHGAVHRDAVFVPKQRPGLVPHEGVLEDIAPLVALAASAQQARTFGRREPGVQFPRQHVEAAQFDHRVQQRHGELAPEHRAEKHHDASGPQGIQLLGEQPLEAHRHLLAQRPRRRRAHRKHHARRFLEEQRHAVAALHEQAHRRRVDAGTAQPAHQSERGRRRERLKLDSQAHGGWLPVTGLIRGHALGRAFPTRQHGQQGHRLGAGQQVLEEFDR